MSPSFWSPHECPHVGFEFERVPGKGYWVRCPDCDTSAWGSNTLKAACREFDRQILKAKQTAQRLEKKERR